MKKSFFNEFFRAPKGACLNDHGFEIPLYFSHIESEWEAVRKRVGVLDLGYRGKIRVSGRDRASFLNNILSNDIKNLRPGHCCHAAFLTPQGKMVTDMNVFVFENDHVLEIDRVLLNPVMEKLKTFVVMDDVVFSDDTDSCVILSFQGSLAGEVLKELEEKFQNIHVFSSQRTGEAGFDAWILMKDMASFCTGLQAVQEIQPVGFQAYNILRIEAGIPWFGMDMNEENFPMEVGLTDAISSTKGCYLGQEAIAKLKKQGGVRKHLMGIVITGEIVPLCGDRILVKGEEVGVITSAVYSYYLKKPIALGYLPSAIVSENVQIIHNSQKIDGQVQTLPFYRKKVSND